MKQIFTWLFSLWLVTAGSGWAQTPQKPFPQQVSYEQGFKPATLSSADVQTAYAAWKAAYVESCGNGAYRVKYDNPGETVSEGIGYGMLLTAYFGDKTIFDGLWQYHKNYRNANGLMHWKIGGCGGGIYGQNSATDGEVDAALALVVANRQWPGTTAPHNYQSDATYLINKMKQFETVVTGSGLHVLKPGDTFGGEDCMNQSYAAPAYYRAFAQHVPADAGYWNNMARDAYVMLNANAHPSTGLVSDWQHTNGTPGGGCSQYGFRNGGVDYLYDACRTPWRFTMDYLWYGTPNAKVWLDRVTDWVEGPAGGIANIKDGYHRDGSLAGGYQSISFTGAFAVGSMTKSQSRVDAFTNYIKGQNLTYENYFGQTLRVLYMLSLTGNFWNPAAAQPPTPDTQAPTAPASLAASNISQAGFTLTWSASTDNVGVAGYEVFRNGTKSGESTTTSFAVTSVSAGTAYSMTVRAKDYAGNVSGLSNALTVTTTAPNTTDRLIYGDALSAGWQNWSWNTNVNFSATSPVKVGSNSLDVQQGGYGGLSLRSDDLIQTSGYPAGLRFWAYGVNGSNQIQVYTQSEDNGNESRHVPISLPANTWTLVTLTWSDLGNPTQVRRVNVQDGVGQSQHVFLDDIRLATGAAPPADTQAPTTPGNLAALAVTQTGFTLTWSASTDNVGVTAYEVFRNGTKSGETGSTTYNVTGLSAGIPYSMTVKARDAAGNASSVGNALTVTTQPANNPDRIIYGDALASGWENWSWNTGTDYANTAVVKAGSYSMGVRLYGAWAGLSLRNPTPINPADYAQGIQFWAYGGSNGNQLQVYTQADDNGNESRHIAINLPADSWKLFTLSWNDLGNPAQVKRINLQDAVGSGHSFFVDDLRLRTTPGARQATGEAEPIASLSPNPTDGPCRLRWYTTVSGSVQVTLTDLRGRLLGRERHNLQPGENLIDLNLGQYPAGMYLVNARQESRQRTFKLLMHP